MARGRLWQAAYWTDSLRQVVITLACLRLDLPAAHAKGAHLLPAGEQSALESTLVRELSAEELLRAAREGTELFLAELERVPGDDPRLARRLREALLGEPPAGAPEG
ncbi:hypothetical protein AB0J21_24035 [Streptomyces sp. NPDC049954]|uniref:hypothetical protein n=1 Tax=Streptomyces sp. NPDC049954 TaxID=3155779 RepID=UPI00342F52BE